MAKKDDGILAGIGSTLSDWAGSRAKKKYREEQAAAAAADKRAAEKRKADLEDIRQRASSGGRRDGNGAAPKSRGRAEGMGGYGGRGDKMRQQEMERQTGFSNVSYKPGAGGKAGMGGKTGMGGKNAASAAAESKRRERRLKGTMI
jgi:hypothetical protein